MTKKKCLHEETSDVGVDNGYIIERCINCGQLLRTRLNWTEDQEEDT